MFMAFFMGTNQVKSTKSKVEQKQLKAYCLEKALEAFKYSQQIPLLELAKNIEDYLSLIGKVNPS